MCCVFSNVAFAAGKYIPKQFSNMTSGSDLYPYSLSNKRQQNATVKKSNMHGIGAGSPMQSTGKRGVVKRPTNARAATISGNTMTTSSGNARRVVQRSGVARSASSGSNRFQTTSGYRNSDSRGVVARGASSKLTSRSTSGKRATTKSETAPSGTSTQKCFANYKQCMDMYCQREDTAYNRCYCSVKLAKIDYTYQADIDTAIKKIIELQYKTDPDLSSVEDYWNETIGTYTDTNSWERLDKALDIDWASMESRVRGQNAFTTGHKYCVEYLNSCAFMASNLRDAYKSEISRDCEKYEATLQKIKRAAEAVVEQYSD